MKKRMISLVLAFVLTLGCFTGLTVPAEAAGSSRYIYVGENHVIYPHADVIDATLVQGNSRTLKFNASYSVSSNEDFYCVAIYRGSIEKVLDQIDRGQEPEVVDFFYVNALEHSRGNAKTEFTWKADSRYGVGDYALVCFMMNGRTGEISDKYDEFWTELHVLSSRNPATDLSIWTYTRDGWEEINADGVMQTTYLDTPIYFAAFPEPYPSTTRLDCSVYTYPDTVIWDRSVNSGYIRLDISNTNGMARVRIVCGKLEKAFWIKKGDFDEKTALKIYHDQTILCAGQEDKCTVRSRENFNMLPTGAVWTSSDPEVATVDYLGKVRAHKPGKVQITAVAGKFSEMVEYEVQYHQLPEDTPVSVRTATQPKQAVGHCSVCGKDDAVNVYEPAIFTDTVWNSWYAPHVDKVYDAGLMKGTSETTFAPNASVTRAMAATVLYRMAGEPEVEGEIPFSDVPEGKYYTSAVIWAAQNEIVNGYPDGTFRPDTNITREQLAAILYRSASKNDHILAEEADLSGFPDASDVHNYAKQAMGWAVSAGLINGVGSGGKSYLQPANNATRAQFATIISRYLTALEENEEHQDPDFPTLT